MNKTKRQNVLLIISVVLALVLLAGMILATVLMSSSNRKEWTYYNENRRSDYITDLQTYTYVSAFSDALKNYVPLKKFVQSLGYNDFIDKLTARIVAAMQDANVPAVRLKTIADVLNNNKISDVFGNITVPFTDLDGFVEWSDALMLSVTEESFFSIIGSMINKFFEITTLTEEEFGAFLYSYLNLYSPINYGLVLDLYGKDNIISLFSDSLYAIRMLSGASDKLGKSMGMSALRTSLYQLGRFYLDIASLGDFFTFEKIFGLPDELNIDSKKEIATEINQEYGNVRGSFGRIFTFFGHFLINLQTEDLIAYSEYLSLKKKNYATIVILNDKIEEGIITEEERNTLARIVDEQNRYHIYASQVMSKVILRAMNEYTDREIAEVITNLREYMLSMRYLMLIMTDTTATTLENYNKYSEMISENSQQLIDALNYFSDKNYTLDEIMRMENITTQVNNADGFDAGSELMELYVSSVFNIWLTNKVNAWGLKNND